MNQLYPNRYTGDKSIINNKYRIFRVNYIIMTSNNIDISNLIYKLKNILELDIRKINVYKTSIVISFNADMATTSMVFDLINIEKAEQCLVTLAMFEEDGSLYGVGNSYGQLDEYGDIKHLNVMYCPPIIAMNETKDVNAILKVLYKYKDDFSKSDNELIEREYKKYYTKIPRKTLLMDIFLGNESIEKYCI